MSQNTLTLIVGPIIIVRHMSRVLIDCEPAPNVARIDFGKREFLFLEILGLKANEVVSRAEFTHHTFWNVKKLPDVYVNRIRRKFNKAVPGAGRHLITVRGCGYMLSKTRTKERENAKPQQDTVAELSVA